MCYHLVRELELDEERFDQYFRTTREQFDQLLFYMEEDLMKYSRTTEVIRPLHHIVRDLYVLALLIFHSLMDLILLLLTPFVYSFFCTVYVKTKV